MVFHQTAHYFYTKLGKYLILGDSAEENYQSIAQFSVRDAEAFPKYEEFLGKFDAVHTCLFFGILSYFLPSPKIVHAITIFILPG